MPAQLGNPNLWSIALISLMLSFRGSVLLNKFPCLFNSRAKTYFLRKKAEIQFSVSSSYPSLG
jgi:hypothetical protein